MKPRRSLVVALAVAMLAAATGVAAQESAPPAVARELASVMMDETMRQTLREQVVVGVVRLTAATLEARLSRRLLDVEWRMLARIVDRFVVETLPPDRVESLAARVYAAHFGDDELRELLRFHGSAVGQKASRLAPTIATETARAIEVELRNSPAVPELMTELGRAFPALGSAESP